VSQPWLANRVCKSEIATRRSRRPVASTKRHCECVTEPRRADTHRSCERVFAGRWTMFDSRGTVCVSPNHGGLTLPALMNVRLCIADGALCSERTSCTKSGWRKPAVVSEPRLQKRNRDSPVTTTGRSLKRNAVASVLPNHGGLTLAALANVRLCIANGVLCGERTSCTRSGWREPAVVREANVRCET
jgi:hypothetical protein